ncbi:rod-binding protein [Pseudoruegeria sp. SK021]|uniref:rod-binding protein n=1 Tax=Pseudoruegeria sp. SK021 TaxID=1933035 RepID=UPI000A228DE3|nr:rod-binding protein [Pseudoruegeria sp. SK021]OSP54738.1 hypothetical protein BV911_11280 [Pseudoruegeria sp. SK021]
MDLSQSRLVGGPPAAGPSPFAAASEAALREVSVKLEASFLAEMLKSSGLGAGAGEFGGGEGEEQFASFLRDAQADSIARAGGLGLAESIFQSLKARQ